MRASNGDSPTPVGEIVDHLFRHQSGRMAAALTRILGPRRIDMVEDVVQEALLRALRLWPYQGVPRDATAWLVQVARNGALDALRREASHRREEEEEVERWAREATAREPAGADDDGFPDDVLRMIFVCCHPALPMESRMALTLKTLCGFGTGEIARAFLAEEATVAQRIVRAKRRIQEEEIPYEVPSPSELPARLDGVLGVLYLLFNEGYAAHGGDDLIRRDLVHEAIRLAGLLLAIPATATPKTHALAALMLFQGARLPARLDAEGGLLTLAEQDRALWDREWTRRGFHHFERSIDGDELSTYHVQASIASAHAAAPSFETTDWELILARYEQLMDVAPSPIVALNRAVARAMARGTEAGLADLDALAPDPVLARYYLLPATRGELFRRKGDLEAAADCFRRALELPCSSPERSFLERKLRACAEDASQDRR